MTHSLSIAKLHALEQAKASYQAAASSLSDPDIILEIHASYDTDSLSTCSSMSLPESECWGSHIAIADTFVRHDSADGCASSPSSIEPDGVIHSSNKLRPSPLCITKVSRFDTQPNKRKDDRVIPKASSMPHCNTPSKRRPSTPPTASRPIFVIFSNSVDSLFQLRNYDLYNDHLTSFAKMLASHISAVDLNIQKTQEAQAARYFTKRQAIYGEDQEAKAADLRARISRLRANRGQMERFAPERYQELCAQALAEL